MTYEAKNFDIPDETRSFPYGSIDFVTIAGRSFGLATFRPGWSWSHDVKPLVGGESCQVPHLDYVISGQLHITCDDGDEFDVGAGDLMSVGPGHNARVVGDVVFTSITLVGEGAETNYAKEQS